MQNIDNNYMQRALDLATRGCGKVSPNPMVGAVIVKNGNILAEGWHSQFGKDHAEIVALKKLKGKADGSTMYVNLEPCNHYGKTPPCVDAIINSKIKEVVIAMKDPNPRTNGKSIRKLRRAGVTVKTGVLKEKAELLNEAFIKFIKTGMPFVTIKSAQTLDGKISLTSGESKWITSDRTRKLSRSRRDNYDAIMVGSNTVLKDDPRLDGAKQSSSLKKVVIDSQLRVPLNAKLFNNLRHKTFLFTTRLASDKKINKYIKEGINVFVCPCEIDKKVNLEWMFKELTRLGIINVLVEGGAHLSGAILRQGLADKLQTYIAPKIFGNKEDLNVFVGIGTKSIDQNIKLSFSSVEQYYEEVIITAYVLRDR